MPTEPRSGFRHKQRIIYAVMYTTTTGTGLYVRLNEFGDHLDGNTFHSDPNKHIVQTQPGDVLVGKKRERWVIASLKVVSWLPDIEAGAEPVKMNFHNHE